LLSIITLIYGLLAGIATGLGALISIAIKNLTNKILSISLGFASGIMIGISTLSLIPSSIETGSIYTAVLGFICGGLFLFIIDISMPHVHKSESKCSGKAQCAVNPISQDECSQFAKMGYFIAFGIALHNLPEGIAIGASSGISEQMGFFTALTIGLHNIAEGLCVAMPLCMGKIRKRRVVFITTFTGLSTLVGTFLGLLFGMISPLFISFSLAFAAGAMIYISSDELIPKSHSSHSEFANIGIMAGFVVALFMP